MSIAKALSAPPSGLPNVDAALRRGIDRLTQKDAAFWDFKGAGRENFDRAPFQYPAMMVPALQRELAKLVVELQPEVGTIADPFLGSGTVLCEAMLLGKEFIGQDINPLALLISKLRYLSLDIEELSAALARCVKKAESDGSAAYAVRFTNQSKWFTKGANIGLSRIRSAICKETNLSARIFLWVSLADAIRMNSNSRTSTYKLHIRPQSECTFTTDDVLDSFKTIATRNLSIISEFRLALLGKGRLAHDRYSHSVRLALGDSTAGLPLGKKKIDMVMTSPPYGDNKTTVPYGQAAWLPLQWISHSDIDAAEEIRRLVASTHQIDTRSLGGRSSARLLDIKCEELRSVSASFETTANALKKFPKDGLMRFTGFVYDLRKVIERVATSCTLNSYQLWTLGHRRIRNVECPLTEIISELFAHYGVTYVHQIERTIPSKRMAHRNSIASTMGSETILILRKEK